MPYRSLRQSTPLVITLVVGVLYAAPARGQVASDLDTLRVSVDPILMRGQLVNVDIALRVTDTLGAFAYRLRYDSLVFEPVQDTFIFMGETLVGIVATDLHPGHFEQFAGSVRSPGEVTFLGADMDLDTGSLCLPGSFPAVRMQWRVLPDAPLGPSALYFENDSLLPSTWNAFSDWWGDDFIRPVFTNTVTDVACVCDCFAESGTCDGSLDIVDVLATINIAFRGEPASPDPNHLCPVTRSDVDCDGDVGVIDVVRVIEVAFRGADPTVTFCRPCE